MFFAHKRRKPLEIPCLELTSRSETQVKRFFHTRKVESLRNRQQKKKNKKNFSTLSHSVMAQPCNGTHEVLTKPLFQAFTVQMSKFRTTGNELPQRNKQFWTIHKKKCQTDSICIASACTRYSLKKSVFGIYLLRPMFVYLHLRLAAGGPQVCSHSCIGQTPGALRSFNHTESIRAMIGFSNDSIVFRKVDDQRALHLKVLQSAICCYLTGIS